MGSEIARNWAFFAVAFSPDGAMLAAGGMPRGFIELWNVADGKRIAKFRGHADGITSLDFSFDGKTLASADSRGTIRLWDLEGKKRAIEEKDQLDDDERPIPDGLLFRRQ